MTIVIQVQGGTVTITAGGQPVSANSANAGQVSQQGGVGGGATADPGTGGGAPGGGGALVIGPIVVDCGSPSVPDDGCTGGGATADPGTGGGGPSSGVVVIGPIVFGGGYGVAGNSGATVQSQPIAVDPNE